MSERPSGEDGPGSAGSGGGSGAGAGGGGATGPGPEEGLPGLHLPARSGLPPEIAAEIRNAIVEARVTAEQRAAFAPLRDLAEAMRANAEALRAVQDTQERIARAVDRTDRSDAVIQSTKALNETFRGVRTAQEALVGRLEREEKRPLRYAAGAALLVLLAGGAVGAFFLLREDDLKGRIEALRAGLGTADREAWEESRRAAEKDLTDRLEALSRKSTLSEADRLAAQRELEGLRGSLETLRRENEALFAGRDDALRTRDEKERLERDNARLREELRIQREGREKAEKALEEKSGALVAALAASRETAAGPGVGGEEAGAAPPRPSPAAPEAGAGGTAVAGSPGGRPPGDGAPAPPEERLSPTAVTDPGQVAKVVNGLNALLGGIGGRESYRVTAAGAVDGDRLVRVQVEARGGDGTVYKAFRAREARFVLDPRRRSLEIRLRDGTVTYLGSRTAAFLEGKYTAYLEVDPEPFRTSGNPVVAVSP